MTDMKEVDELVKKNKEFGQIAKLYFDMKKPVRVTYVHSSNWDAGNIKEFFGDGFMLETLRDDCIPIFYLQVKNIELFRERRNE